jgi:hypothetical protein
MMMKRVNLDTAPDDVRAFVQNLPPESDGVELALHGQVIWKLIRPGELSDSEKQALLARGREIARQVRDRVKKIPQSVLKRKVQDAVDEVRRRQQK